MSTINYTHTHTQQIYTQTVNGWLCVSVEMLSWVYAEVCVLETKCNN